MKPKKVNYSIAAKDDPAWEILDAAMVWHDDELRNARIALAWRKETKEDKDGHIVLGRCVKVSDLHKEFMPFDFVIVLNREYWSAFSDSQRTALVDHELCHAAVSLDKEGDEREDEKGRVVYRIRKHDIEEFRDVVSRHGLYKSDLMAFAESIKRAKEAPLLVEVRQA